MAVVSQPALCAVAVGAGAQENKNPLSACGVSARALCQYLPLQEGSLNSSDLPRETTKHHTIQQWKLASGSQDGAASQHCSPRNCCSKNPIKAAQGGDQQEQVTQPQVTSPIRPPAVEVPRDVEDSDILGSSLPSGKDTEAESCGGYSLGSTFHFGNPYLWGLLLTLSPHTAAGN